MPFWGGNAQLYKRYRCKCKVQTDKGEQTSTVIISSNKGIDYKKLAEVLQGIYPRDKYGRITQHKVTVESSVEMPN